MKNFYLHVGLPRCASTLIENIFLYPEHQGYSTLRNSGILPLPRVYKEFRRAYAKPVWTDELYARIRDYHIGPMLHHDAQGFFTSDEGLTGIHDRPNEPLPYADRAPFLNRLLEGLQPRIILLVRNQAQYVVSMYGLHLQNGGQMEFDDYVAAFPYAHLDWLKVADAYATAFGLDAVSVFPFEKDTYSGLDSSEPANFLEAIQRTMAIAQPIRLEDQLLVNPSLVPKYHQAQLTINRGADATTVDIPKTEAAYHNATRETPLTPHQVNAILARYSDSNRELFARFMPGFDSTIYQPAS
tara:strand:+ start:30713 stop:31606 length:894 start_codon:yes stop_codon:yes gene_type:complete